MGVEDNDSSSIPSHKGGINDVERRAIPGQSDMSSSDSVEELIIDG